MSVGTESSTVRIKVGDREYPIDTGKIPYFKAFVDFQRSAGLELVHGDIPFFKVIQVAVKYGCRHYFSLQLRSLEQYRLLCNTLDFLAIDVLEEHESFDSISRDLKCWTHYKSRDPEAGDKLRRSRDAAFRLVYFLIKGEFDHNNPAINSTLFIVQFVIRKRRLFDSVTRSIVKEAFKATCNITEKQQRTLS